MKIFYTFKSQENSVRNIKSDREGFIISDRYELFRDGKIYDHNMERYLTPTKSDRKYYKYELAGFDKDDNYTRKKFFIHKLVAQNFIYKPDNATNVVLMDGNKENYHVDNLCWMDSKNTTWYQMGRGIHKNSKPNNKIDEIRHDISKGLSLNELVIKYSRFGISKEFIESLMK